MAAQSGQTTWVWDMGEAPGCHLAPHPSPMVPNARLMAATPASVQGTSLYSSRAGFQETSERETAVTG